MPFDNCFFAFERIQNLFCGHIFDELAEQILKEVFSFILRDIRVFFAFSFYAILEDKLNELLALLLAIFSNVIELGGHFFITFRFEGHSIALIYLLLRDDAGAVTRYQLFLSRLKYLLKDKLGKAIRCFPVAIDISVNRLVELKSIVRRLLYLNVDLCLEEQLLPIGLSHQLIEQDLIEHFDVLAGIVHDHVVELFLRCHSNEC